MNHSFRPFQLSVAVGLVAVLAMTSCTSPLDSTPWDLPAEDVEQISSHLMSSFNASSSTTQSNPGRATITVGSTRSGGTLSGAPYPTGVSFDSVAGKTTVLTGYPEAGLSSSFTVVAQAPRTDVFLVTVVTTFPVTDARKTYTEAYYVQDVTPGTLSNAGIWASAPDGQWTSDDPLVTDIGGIWTQDQGARASMVLTFVNGNNRTERVWDNSTLLAMSKASSDSMKVKATSVPAIVASGVTYSSSVVYVTKATSLTLNSSWPASTAVPNIIGIRYYSEAQGAWSSVSFELIVADTIDLTTWTGTEVYNLIFQNGQGIGKHLPVTRWGNSVLREDSSGVKNMTTNLFNATKAVTYKLVMDSTGKVITVTSAAGNLIQAGL